MYRAITYLALESLRATANGDALHNAESLTSLAREISETVALEFFTDEVGAESLPNKSGEVSKLRLLADGSDITSQIRSAEVSASVSVIAADEEVRKALVARQREFGERFENIVAEGRDIGTVVFPDAELKVYLDADLKERARRRAKEMNANGMSTTVEEQIEEIAYRDEFDSTREASPLTQASDAVRLDTSDMTIGGQVEAVLELVSQRQRSRNDAGSK